MKNLNLILRIPLSIILLMHSIPSIVSGDVNGFGNEFLRSQGFGDFGLILAWTIKISHICAALCLVINRYIILSGIITIIILIGGIIMVHISEGWFVVGGGRNGVEFNVLMIAVYAYLMANTKRCSPLIR